jgi:hypothetical protein
MQNDISNKIRLLLNELAILNQPDVLEGKFFYHPNTLLQLKSLSSELYLLSDRLVNIGQEAPVDIPPVVESPAVVQEVMEIPREEKVPEPVAPVVQEKVQEVVIPVAQEIPVVREEVVAPPVAVETTKVEVAIPVAEHKAVDLFDGKISFTRRFEYVNNLFGGDSAAFAAFLAEISSASDRDKAMHIFESAFEQRNWKRKSETSDDLKSLIKKVK